MPVLRLAEAEANSQAQLPTKIEEEKLSDDNFSEISDSDKLYSPTEAEEREAIEESDDDKEEVTSPKGNFNRYNSHPESLLYSYLLFSQKKNSQEAQSNRTTRSCIRIRFR